MTKKNRKDRPSDGRTVVVQNRKARHDYAIQDTVEAGLVLLGSEVKAIRNGDVQINEAFVRVRNGRASLENAYVGEYAQAAAFPHESRRARPLLLKARELDKLEDQQRIKGLSIVPLSLYFKGGWLKVELGIGKGKTNIDRRDSIKDRDLKREVDRALRRR